MKKERCSNKGCAKRAQNGGLCRKHGAYSIAAAAQNGAVRPPHPAGGYDARAFVASAIVRGGGGEIEIDTHNLQADVSCAAAPRSPSLCPSIMAPNLSDDDEDLIGAWICRSSHIAKLGSVNNTVARPPPHPAAGHNDATVVVASAIAGGGGGEIKIDTRNLQADVSCTTAPGSPSLRRSIMAPNIFDDDEEIIGDWIWRSSRMARLGSVKNANGLS